MDFIYKIKGLVCFEKKVYSIGNTGHIYIPRQYIGKKVKVVVLNE